MLHICIYIYIYIYIHTSKLGLIRRTRNKRVGSDDFGRHYGTRRKLLCKISSRELQRDNYAQLYCISRRIREGIRNDQLDCKTYLAYRTTCQPMVHRPIFKLRISATHYHYDLLLLLLLLLNHSYLTIAINITLRPIFKLRISKFGVWVKQNLKRRRWIFLVHHLIS